MNHQDYSQILRSFRSLREVEKGRWRAACPIHKGGLERHPSVELKVKDNGHLIGKCFACGVRLPEMLSTLMVPMSALTGRADCAGPGKPPVGEEKRKIECVYDYRDEAGTLLYQVVRWKPKGFCQRVPDASTRDGWQWMIPIGTRRVLYRLPELIAEPNRLVVLVEGEKDADRLASAGLLATTNAGGAHGFDSAGKWLDCYSESLRCRHVAIIPDNDEPGLRHARCVAGSLMYFGAASVRISKLAKGKDASEFLDGGGTIEQIRRAISAAVEWKPIF